MRRAWSWLAMVWRDLNDEDESDLEYGLRVAAGLVVLSLSVTYLLSGLR